MTTETPSAVHAPIKDGLQCTECGKTQQRVIDSRLIVRTQAIRRVRECPHCRTRTTTYELTQDDYERYQQMDRDMARIARITRKTITPPAPPQAPPPPLHPATATSACTDPP